MPNCRLNNYRLSDCFVCIHHLINIVFFPCNYGVHQKECNKCTSAALISVAYRAPRLSFCVHRTLTLSLKVPSCKTPQSLDCGAFPVKMRHVGKNRGVWQKVPCRNTLPAQIQRQTIKVRRISYQKVAHKFVISVAFFLTYTV